MLMLLKRVLAVGLMLGCTSAWAANWSFDASSAALKFIVTGIGGAHGKFAAFSGTAKYDPSQLKDLKVNLNIDATSMDAGAKTLAYQGESVFFVDKYKSLNFVSTQIVPQGQYAAKMKGILTMRGVSKPIEWDLKVDQSQSNDKYVTFKAVTTIQRSQWNMNGYASMASDKVDLIIQGRLIAAS